MIQFKGDGPPTAILRLAADRGVLPTTKGDEGLDRFFGDPNQFRLKVKNYKRE